MWQVSPRPARATAMAAAASPTEILSMSPALSIASLPVACARVQDGLGRAVDLAVEIGAFLLARVRMGLVIRLLRGVPRFRLVVSHLKRFDQLRMTSELFLRARELLAQRDMRMPRLMKPLSRPLQF